MKPRTTFVTYEGKMEPIAQEKQHAEKITAWIGKADQTQDHRLRMALLAVVLAECNLALAVPTLVNRGWFLEKRAEMTKRLSRRE